MALWTPSQISTSCWLDASDAANRTIVSSAFSAMADKSGNGKNAAQVTAGDRPALVTAAQNGLDAARFDGASYFMTLVNVAQESGQHIILAGDTASISTSYRKLLASTAGSDLGLLFGAVSQNYRPSIFWNGNQRAVQASAVQRKAVFRWRYVVGSPSSATTQIDGGTETTTTFTASALTNWGAIGELGAYPGFDFYEMVILPASTLSDDVDRVIGYIAWRWGLEGNLPPGHPYKSAAPTVGGPTITSQPANESVGVGDTAEFTVAATGTGTLSYQWKNGADDTSISGATSATYSFTAALPDNGKTYYCTVTDDDGSIDSNTVTLTVSASSAYTPTLADANKVLRFTAASPEVTIPTNASVAFPVGTILTIRQAGTGTLTLVTTGLTINGTVPSWAQHVEVQLRKVGADEWDVT